MPRIESKRGITATSIVAPPAKKQEVMPGTARRRPATVTYGQKSVRVPRSGAKLPAGAVEVDPLRVKVAMVTGALGSFAKTADFLGVARSQPGRWLAGDESPNPRARRLIQDFEYVWDRLTDDRPPDAAHIWLRSANAFLKGATPLTRLKTHGPDEVIAAIDAEEAGSYA